MRVGDLDVLPVWDGRMTFVEPPGFPDHDSTEFAPHARYITPAGEYLADLGGFLIRTGGQVVLVDAGLGPGPEGGTHHPAGDPEDVAAFIDMFRRYGVSEDELIRRERDLGRQSVRYGSLPDNLAKLGVRPGDVTDVVLSHLHPDHMGWVSEDGRSFFAHARIWTHSADADHYLGNSPPDETGMRIMLGTAPTKQRMAPVHDQLELWTSDTHVAPGILLRHLPGHTPGNAIAVVSSGADTAFILGDTFHCPLELVDEGFHIMGDLDHEQALRQKSVLRREIEAGSVPVASPHFADLRFGRVVLDSGRRSWVWID
jgi:glyoxylase-like metal-dependent hydrolase (beta-lactamase superfamily II)